MTANVLLNAFNTEDACIGTITRQAIYLEPCFAPYQWIKRFMTPYSMAQKQSLRRATQKRIIPHRSQSHDTAIGCQNTTVTSTFDCSKRFFSTQTNLFRKFGRYYLENQDPFGRPRGPRFNTFKGSSQAIGHDALELIRQKLKKALDGRENDNFNLLCFFSRK